MTKVTHSSVHTRHVPTVTCDPWVQGAPTKGTREGIYRGCTPPRVPGEYIPGVSRRSQGGSGGCPGGCPGGLREAQESVREASQGVSEGLREASQGVSEGPRGSQEVSQEGPRGSQEVSQEGLREVLGLPAWVGGWDSSEIFLRKG